MSENCIVCRKDLNPGDGVQVIIPPSGGDPRRTAGIAWSALRGGQGRLAHKACAPDHNPRAGVWVAPAPGSPAWEPWQAEQQARRALAQARRDQRRAAATPPTATAPAVAKAKPAPPPPPVVAEEPPKKKGGKGKKKKDKKKKKGKK